MKQTIQFLIIAVLWVSTSYGQQPMKCAMSDRHHPDWKYIESQAIPRRVNKSTSAIGSRLIAITNYACDGVSYTVQDSIAFLYSGTRGGDLETGIKSDYTYTFQPYFNYKTTNIYDVADNISSSLWQYQWPLSTAWENSSRATWTYDASGNVASIINEIWDSTLAMWFADSKNVYTYTLANKIATLTIQYWDGSATAWLDAWKSEYTYDVSDNVTTRLNQMWDAPSLSWIDLTRNNYTYNAANLVLTETTQFVDSTGAWSNTSLTTYIYDASGNKEAETSSLWNAATAAWDDDVRFLYSSFAGARPQTVIEQSFNPSTLVFENGLKRNYSYNSHAQVTYQYQEGWSGSAWVLTSGVGATKYYYEEYTTKVAEVTNDIGVAIYPIPATGNIRIANNSSEPVSVIITDALDKCVARTQAAVYPHTTFSINVTALPGGVYYLKGLTDSGVAVNKTISVIR